MCRNKRSSAEKGMTLIEVLVALLVLGTAVAMLLVLLGQTTTNTQSIETNVLSRIVAENAMVETRLAEGDRGAPTLGAVELGGIEFEWDVSFTAAPIEGLEIVRVDVRRGDDPRIVATLSSLRPAPGTGG